MNHTLVINEIYLSIQGESTFAGLPCVFVRLTACNLRCSYCDTAYAFSEGKKMSLGEIRGRIAELAKPFEIRNPKSEIRNHVRLPLVELTGGEPLLQPGAIPLTKALCDDGFTVLVETSGALDIAPLDARVRRIMDLKCPSSGEVGRNQIRHRHAGGLRLGQIATVQVQPRFCVPDTVLLGHPAPAPSAGQVVKE